MSQLPYSLKHAWKAAACALSAIAVLAACSGSGPTAQLSAHYILAPVEGGSCSLLSLAGKTIAGPASTRAGVALLDFSASTGMAQLSCEGGSYTDEASGTSMPGLALRSYVDLGTHNVTAVVTPLTELTVRTLGDSDPTANYPSLSTAVAAAFGLAGIDINAQVPDDLGSRVLADSKGSRYGAMLATLSQLQKDGLAGTQASDVMTNLAAALTVRGRFNDAKRMNSVTDALQNLMSNSRLQTQVADMADSVLRDIFEQMQHQTVAATITYIDTDSSMMQSGEAASTLFAGAESSIDIVGRNLRLGLGVTLGGVKCQLHDLQALSEFDVQSDDDLMIADCPARDAGATELLIADGGDVISRTAITVEDAATPMMARAVAPAKHVNLATGSGTANVTGTVTAVAPLINVGVNAKAGAMPGSLRYDQPTTFAVKGVVVELLDLDASNALLMTTSTDKNGQYQFLGAEAGKRVVVRVKAQMLKTPDPVSRTGPQWNIAVRDNTSTTHPKSMYTLDSPPLTTVNGANLVPIQASLGFDTNGAMLSVNGKDRQSAFFAILDVVYAAATKLQEVDPNINLGSLNIYWSVANIGSAGSSKLTHAENAEQGNIVSSCYQNQGTLPGLFILGTADKDTDEFDRGVIGHEFGHYLQDILSYSDSPGGNHAKKEFKDASLAYGEGYGTAIGALLTGTPYYTDSLDYHQGLGAATDLSQPTIAGVRKGFYSEESVGYVMYTLGNMEQGFARLWRAVAALKNEHHSATIFAFLNQFKTQNPNVNIDTILAQENIRSTDPFGALAAGSSPDPAINANASGAADLEVQYLPVSLAAGAPTPGPEIVNTSTPSYCLTSKLSKKDDPPVAYANALGMSRRFTFKSTYTGWLIWRPLNRLNQDFNVQSLALHAREERGNNVKTEQLEIEMTNSTRKLELSAIKVTEGRVYSLTMRVEPTSIWNGNTCGNTLQLLKAAI